MNEIVSCMSLTKSYGGGVPAIDGINLNLNSGKVIGLLGPNGSGKTTLIKMICGLLKPDAGAIYVHGAPIGPMTKAIVSYLPDRNCLDKNRTIQDLMHFYADFYSDFDMTQAYEMLTRLAINPYVKLKTLSKGNQEKVQLILVMSRRAQLYVLDEPIAGVDPAARDYILSTIMGCHSPESTVLISTHLIADIEQILDEAVFLQQGHIALYDSVENIRQREGKSVDALFREVYRCLGN